MKYLLIPFLSFLYISCGNTSEEGIAITEIQKIDNSIYGNANFHFPILSENAKTEVMHWGAFEDFEIQAKAINGNTIEAIKEKAKLMVSQLDSLVIKIPDTLSSRAIYSRVMVVKTRTNLLKQEVNKAHFDSIRLQEYFNEMNISVKNLLVQINEKFQKDAIDLQRINNEKQELKNQKRFYDSIYKAELKDQNKSPYSYNKSPLN